MRIPVSVPFFLENILPCLKSVFWRCSVFLCVVLLPYQLIAQTVGELKKLSVEELMNVEVTSVSKHAEKLTEAASAIQIITQEDIRQSGVSSVPEALRLASNLQVAQANSSQWAISARGFNNILANKLLVLIDGRVVYTPMYAGVFWDVQNLLLEDIDRIEVISGPGGTLWGANAVNGVINIITKSSKDTSGGYVEVAGGTELRGLASARYGGKILDNLTYRAYGTTFKRDDTRLVDSTQANDGWKIAQGGFRLDWEASENDLVTLQSNFYSDRPDPDGASPVEATGNNILSKWTHTISEKSDFQIQLYYDQTWRDFRNDFAEKLRTYDFEGQHRFKLGRNQEIIWGLGFRLMDHEVNNLELFRFDPARKELRLYSAFVQDEIALVKNYLHLTLGSKFEHNTYTGFQYQPSGRLRWTPTQHLMMWTAFSRAVRTPSRTDRDFSISLAPGIPFLMGSDEFINEKVRAYELGWRFQLQSNSSFSISTFINEYRNIRSAEPSVPTVIPIVIGNGVEGETYGVELSVTSQLKDWWRLRGGYTFLQKELRVKRISNDLNEGTAESNDPKHQFLVQSYFDLTKSIELGTVFRYVGTLPDRVEAEVVSGYAELDIRLGWKLNKVIELNIVGQNLLKKGHVEFIPSIPAREIERSVYGKIIARF
jgi:iron complex outermembrane receptor protein